MDWAEIFRLVAAIASGLAATIPLVIKLVKYVEQAIKEKNWQVLLAKVTELMKVAELKFEEGAEREEWVIAMIKASADSINYNIDYDVVREMIRSFCAMSKIVNAPPAISEEAAGE